MSDVASRSPPPGADDTPTDAQPRSEAAAVAGHPERKPRIVIVGGGFGGVAAARVLRKSNAEVVLIDRRNHHIFQPLLYQVATAVLSPSDVAAPIRQLARKQKNLSVMLAEVTGLDLKSHSVTISSDGVGTKIVPFDYLILAPGMQASYFGHDEFAEYAPSLKTIADGEAIRAKILGAYEKAELTEDPAERARLLTFILVGAGPTGVELAASIAQMGTLTLRSNFRNINPAKTSILLLDGAKRILPSYADSLSRKAAKRLKKLGVEILTEAMVEKVDDRGVIIAGKRLESATVLWTAGVAPSPVLKLLNAETDRAGRVCVTPFLALPSHESVFVVGDAAMLASKNDRPLPGVAQVAIQEGRYVGRSVAAQIRTDRAPTRPFRYFDKGNMAVVGKNFAILETRRIRLSGFTMWFVWAFIHLMFLPQVQNRLRVERQWLWSYLTGQRSSRLIPESQFGHQPALCGRKSTVIATLPVQVSSERELA
jgi:NADH:ubiquinone reductase (H+-translocating)